MKHNKAKKKEQTSTTPHIDRVTFMDSFAYQWASFMQKDHKETHNCHTTRT